MVLRKARLAVPLILLLPQVALSDDISLEGVWIVEPAISSGISGGEGWNAADLLEGKVVTIKANTLTLPTAIDCAIGPAVEEVLRDDMETWGSDGGSWSDLGFVAVGDTYSVKTLTLDCGDMGPQGLMMQDTSKTLLLDIGDRVFSPLVRKGAT